MRVKVKIYQIYRVLSSTEFQMEDSDGHKSDLRTIFLASAWKIRPLLILPSSGIQRRVVRMWTDFSDESITSIFRFENQPSKKPACSKWLCRILHVDFLLCWFSAIKMEVIRSSENSVRTRIKRCYIPEDGNIHYDYVCRLSVCR
jgi:hypothetical protein